MKLDRDAWIEPQWERIETFPLIRPGRGGEYFGEGWHGIYLRSTGLMDALLDELLSGFRHSFATS